MQAFQHSSLLVRGRRLPNNFSELQKRSLADVPSSTSLLPESADVVIIEFCALQYQPPCDSCFHIVVTCKFVARKIILRSCEELIIGGNQHHVLLPVRAIRLSTRYASVLGIGKVEFRGSEPTFAWRETSNDEQHRVEAENEDVTTPATRPLQSMSTPTKSNRH
uniref:Uncharacterized protein n=1 Tax=Timema tahoe TaxID=61484 RepID=A0A7R9IQR9_9NEOP|nr:unnamed protein product [Timema tahoe]